MLHASTRRSISELGYKGCQSLGKYSLRLSLHHTGRCPVLTICSTGARAGASSGRVLEWQLPKVFELRSSHHPAAGAISSHCSPPGCSSLQCRCGQLSRAAQLIIALSESPRAAMKPLTAAAHSAQTLINRYAYFWAVLKSLGCSYECLLFIQRDNSWVWMVTWRSIMTVAAPYPDFCPAAAARPGPVTVWCSHPTGLSSSRSSLLSPHPAVVGWDLTKYGAAQKLINQDGTASVDSSFPSC